jgi:hypothetical protein
VVSENSALLLKRLTDPQWNVFSGALAPTCMAATHLLPL